MLFSQKVALLMAAVAAMDSSKVLCVQDAEFNLAAGKRTLAVSRLNDAAQYAWGFWRPEGWDTTEWGRGVMKRTFTKDEKNRRLVWATVSRLHLYHPECAPIGQGVEKFVSTQRSGCHVCHGRLDRNPEVMS